MGSLRRVMQVMWKRRKLVFERVIAGVVAKGALGADVVEVNVAFEDDLGIGGDFEVHRLALDQFDRFLAQETREQELIQILGERQYPREHGNWVSANCCRYLHTTPFPLAFRATGSALPRPCESASAYAVVRSSKTCMR